MVLESMGGHLFPKWTIFINTTGDELSATSEMKDILAAERDQHCDIPTYSVWMSICQLFERDIKQ